MSVTADRQLDVRDKGYSDMDMSPVGNLATELVARHTPFRQELWSRRNGIYELARYIHEIGRYLMWTKGSAVAESTRVFEPHIRHQTPTSGHVTRLQCPPRGCVSPSWRCSQLIFIATSCSLQIIRT